MIVRQFVVLLAALGALAPLDASPTQASAASVIYLSATDGPNRPVSGLGVGGLLIREDGKEREILSVEPAALEPHVAVLVDDNGTGVFKFGLLRLAEKLQGR